MTKQEKLLKGILSITMSRPMTYQLLNYLKSHGVKFVELPSIWNGKGEVMSALEYKKKLIIEEII